MSTKQIGRERRAKRGRSQIRISGRHRLTVHRSGKHMYSQLISPDSTTVLAAASTLEKAVRGSVGEKTDNRTAAEQVGRLIAERAQAKGVKQVAFDRSGFKYHGRVKALAEAARNHGLEF